MFNSYQLIVLLFRLILGILVDEVREVVTLGESEIDRSAQNKKNQSTFINGIGKNGEDLISLFDITALIDPVD